MNNKIIVLCGKGASGKDTTLQLLKGQYSNLQTCVSHTTRPPRVNEEHGREYFFVDIAEFEAMHENGEFVEIRDYDVANGETWYYGMSEKEISSKLTLGNVIMILDVKGLKELKEYYQCSDSQVQIVSFYIDVDEDTRLDRYLKRENLTLEVVEEAVRRIYADDSDFANAKYVVDYVVHNPLTSEISTYTIVNHLENMGIKL